MKKLIVGAAILSLSAGNAVIAGEGVLSAEDHIERLTKNITEQNQDIIAELITDTSIHSLSAELSSTMNWNSSDTEKLKLALAKRKGALVASILGSQLGIGSPSSIVWEEVKKIKPAAKNLSKESTKTIEEKISKGVDLFEREQYYKKALTHYNKAIALQPKMAEAYMYRGVLYVQMGQMSDAEKDLKRLYELKSDLAKELKHVVQTKKEKQPAQFFGVSQSLNK